MHVAFNSFRKCCSNVLPAALCFCFVIKTEILPIMLGFYNKTARKAMDKTLGQSFLKEFNAMKSPLTLS